MNTPTTFYELLNHFLQVQDRSASWLAQRLNLHPSTVSRWLNNETLPDSPQTVRRIAEVLGIHDKPNSPWLQRFLVACGFGYMDSNGIESPTPTTAFYNSVGTNIGNMVMGYGDIHAGDMHITQGWSRENIVEGIRLFKQQLHEAHNRGLDIQVAQAAYDAVDLVEHSLSNQENPTPLLPHIYTARTLLLEQMQNATITALLTPLIVQLDQVARQLHI